MRNLFLSLSVMRSPVTTLVTQYPSSLADHRDILERDLCLYTYGCDGLLLWCVKEIDCGGLQPWHGELFPSFWQFGHAKKFYILSLLFFHAFPQQYLWVSGFSWIVGPEKGYKTQYSLL